MDLGNWMDYVDLELKELPVHHIANLSDSDIAKLKEEYYHFQLFTPWVLSLSTSVYP